MKFADFIPPILGFILVLNALSTKDQLKIQDYVKFITGILIMGFTIWTLWDNSEIIETLNSNVTDLVEQRELDSIRILHLQSTVDSSKNILDSLGLGNSVIKLKLDTLNRGQIATKDKVDKAFSNSYKQNSLVSVSGSNIHHITISGVSWYDNSKRLQVNPYNVYEGLRNGILKFNITDKRVFLIYVDGTTGKKFENDIIQILTWGGYSVYGFAKSADTTLKKGMSITSFQNKLALIIGNPS